MSSNPNCKEFIPSPFGLYLMRVHQQLCVSQHRAQQELFAEQRRAQQELLAKQLRDQQELFALHLKELKVIAEMVYRSSGAIT